MPWSDKALKPQPEFLRHNKRSCMLHLRPMQPNKDSKKKKKKKLHSYLNPKKGEFCFTTPCLSPHHSVFIFIYFNWSIITLQYCEGFCHTSIWIAHGYTRVPFLLKPLPIPSLPVPSPPLPSRLSQSTGFGCPVSYIRLTLVICFTYGNVHVSTLFSQIIPPSPSPTESKSLFSVFPLLPLHHSRATLLLSGGGAQLKASPASHSPRPYTDAEGTRHFVLSYWLILISCCTRSWRLHSIQTDIPTPLLLHKTCLLHCHHLQNSNKKTKPSDPRSFSLSFRNNY